jgi:SecD/SecF fusion protein
MLENAKGHFALILILVVGSIASLMTKDLRYGLDLDGGTELIYRVDAKKAELGPETSFDVFMSDILGTIRDRIDPQGTLDAQVIRRGYDGIYIALPGMSAQQAKQIEAKITRLGTLQMQICAYDEDPKTKKKVFDLAAEKQRFDDWIALEGNRDKLLKDPLNVDQFLRLSNENGGPISSRAKLRWVPHLVKKTQNADSTAFDYSYSMGSDGKSGELAANVATLFTTEEYQAGYTEAKPELVEFLPINFGETGFTGEDLDANKVQPSVDQNGSPVVLYEIRPERVQDYYDVSDKYTNHQSAIILDGFIKSAPTYITAIPGRGQIQGFTRPEAQSLSDVLKRGSLKVKPIRESSRTIGATLGKQSIERGKYSLGIGAIMVLLFILFYYRKAGIVATLGVVLNVGFVLGAVSFIGATLTLPGLGGLVLTIGMAVDANILIYERIREEIKNGKELALAVRHGFERALVTILDANVTTFIAGFVLYQFGVGPIKGFAVTLMIGIATSLFTAFFVSRAIFHFMLQRKMERLDMTDWFAGLRMNFLKFSKPALVLSAVAIIGGLSLFFSVSDHDKLSLDFTGGADVRVVTKTAMSPTELKNQIGDIGFDPQVNTVGMVTDGDKATKFSVKLKIDQTQAKAYTAAQKAAEDAGQIYEPPYVTDLQKALQDILVPKAFTGAGLVQDERVNYARITIHNTKPTTTEAVTATLAKALDVPVDKVVVEVMKDGKVDEKATSGFEMRLQFDVAKSIDSEAKLVSYISQALTPATTANSEAAAGSLNLSNPIPDATQIGTRMVGELKTSAIEAMLLSLFFIVMYIRVRFQQYKYGIAAVCALIHDVLVALGLVVGANALGIVESELSLSMIAAFLTIIGYSINDTIVIFDRVRENLANQAKFGDTSKSFADTINISINQTLARTILTSCTTMFVVGVLFAVNKGSGSELEGFAFAMIIGILTGTYSTIFIASPVLMWLRSREKEDSGLSEDGGLAELSEEAQDDGAVPAASV